VEVGNEAYSKGTAIEFLADKYAVPMEKTIGIGDQINDLPMIEKAGLGLAVKNADVGLKRHAKVLEYTHEEDAVAHAILQYGYKQE
jgi:hydroxymethylpyrimidine pyrophosphatase-like HAD family hydrolase